MRCILLLLAMIVSKAGIAQLMVSGTTSLKATGTAMFVLNDLGVTATSPSSSVEISLKFTGTNNVDITSSTPATFRKLLVAKSAQSSVRLLQNINIRDTVEFMSGLFDMTTKKLSLDAGALLLNEQEGSHLIAGDGGIVTTTVNLSAPNQTNPGNIGVTVTSNRNFGNVTINRGHQVQTGIGLPTSIRRFYEIQPAISGNADADLQFQYLESELNGLNENTLALFRSTNNRISWSIIPQQNPNALSNKVIAVHVDTLALFAISFINNALPVRNLQFHAARLSPAQVKLSWSTEGETRNSGFVVERKTQKDLEFKAIQFVPSKTTNGTGSNLVKYDHVDANNESGISYYRLRQVDLDGASRYSAVEVVKSSLPSSLFQLWPNPSQGTVYAQVANAGMMSFYDISGKLVKQQPVQANTIHTISGLSKGVYTLLLISGEIKESRQLIIQ